MDNYFEFAALSIFSHIIIGCILVVLLSVFLNGSRFNAATRHDMWLGCLALLLLMPLLLLIPSRPTIDLSLAADSQPGLLEPIPTVETFVLENRAAEDFASLDNIAPAIQNNERANLARALSGTLSLSLIGKIAVGIILLGGIIRLTLFCKALSRLDGIFERAQKVDHRLQQKLDGLVDELQVEGLVQVRKCSEVRSPITGGWLISWILLPTYLAESDANSGVFDRVVLHELVHIKRKDPAIAILLAIIGSLFFWHPAVLFTIRKIKFEREIACDDCVLSHLGSDEKENLQHYAEDLVSLADRSSHHIFPGLTVACTQAASGLNQRIRILVDRNLDHRPNSRGEVGAGSTIALVAVIAVTSPLWPAIPVIGSETPSSWLTSAEFSNTTIENRSTQLTVGAEFLESGAAAVDDAEPREDPLYFTVLRPGLPEPISAYDAISPGASLSQLNRYHEQLAPKSEQSGQQFVWEDDPEFLSVIEWDFASTPQVSPESLAKSSEPAEVFNILANQYSTSIQPNGRPLEEILVIGEKTLRSVYYQLQRTERSAYEMFNELNEGGNYDIVCERRISGDSRIPTQSCEPRFLDQYRRENAMEINQSARTTNGVIGRIGSSLFGPRELSYEQLQRRARVDFEEMNDQMVNLAMRNDEFNSLLMRIGELQEEIREMEEESNGIGFPTISGSSSSGGRGGAPSIRNAGASMGPYGNGH